MMSGGEYGSQKGRGTEPSVHERNMSMDLRRRGEVFNGLRMMISGLAISSMGGLIQPDLGT